MAAALDNLDTQPIRDALGAWQDDEAVLDAQLLESLAALEAYQSHLDGWQNELARQREELNKSAQQLERDRAAFDAAIAEQNKTAKASNNAELEDARTQISALTAEIEARSQEVQQLKQTRAEVIAKPLPEPPSDKPSPPRTANPVLGSIVEQFGKLRQQRAVDRQTGKNPR